MDPQKAIRQELGLVFDLHDSKNSYLVIYIIALDDESNC